MILNRRKIASFAVAILLISSIGYLLIPKNTKQVSETTQESKVDDIKSIANLPTRFADIRALAWQKMEAMRQKPYKSQIEVVPKIGPNSLDCSPGLIEVIKGVEKFYQNSKIPKKVYLLIGNTDKDKQWFIDESVKLLPPKYRSYQGKEMINPETVNDKGEGVLWSDDPCNDSLELSSEDQIRVAHGFFHVLQTYQFHGSEKKWGRWGEVPRWILEGGATFTHSFWKQGLTKDKYLSRPENNYELYKLGESFFLDYYKYTPGEAAPWKYTDQWDNYRAYDAGSYICEVMVALKGPESILEIYGDYLKTNDFNQSFNNVFGTTWTDAESIISVATYKVIENSVEINTPWLLEVKSGSSSRN